MLTFNLVIENNGCSLLDIFGGFFDHINVGDHHLLDFDEYHLKSDYCSNYICMSYIYDRAFSLSLFSYLFSEVGVHDFSNQI